MLTQPRVTLHKTHTYTLFQHLISYTNLAISLEQDFVYTVTFIHCKTKHCISTLGPDEQLSGHTLCVFVFLMLD